MHIYIYFFFTKRVGFFIIVFWNFFDFGNCLFVFCFFELMSQDTLQAQMACCGADVEGVEVRSNLEFVRLAMQGIGVCYPQLFSIEKE